MFVLLDKQVQYPSLDLLKPIIVNNNLTDVNSKLEHIDNCSSEEEMDTKDITSTLIEPPVFDRSTKVLQYINSNRQYFTFVFKFFQPSIKMNQYIKPEIIKPLYKTNDELDDENNEV